MFQPVERSEEPQVVPPGTSISVGDWHALAGLWHPVALVQDVGDRPVAARLLDVDLVVYRTTSGISVAHDRCPHRGTRLSLGRIIDDCLVCPMHGLFFDGPGRCVRIPSRVPPDTRIPASLRLQSVPVRIHAGLVWVCLSAEPRRPPPQWSVFEDPALKTLYFPVETWHTSAGRHVENFNDQAHFPWVHVDSFGGDTAAAVADHEVVATADGLTYWVPYTEGFNRFPDGVPGNRRDVIYRYELTLPFCTLLTVEPVDSDYRLFFGDAVCPVSATECRIFQMATDTTGNPDVEFWQRDTLTINREDRPLVESQQPQSLPLNVRDEMHIPADRMSIAYRRALVAQLGLGGGAPSSC